MAGWLAARNVNFVSLRSAIFCVQCELIGENSTPYCLACGSQALLSLSRILGGSLRDQQTAHLIADAELDRLVRELLRTIPPSQPMVAKKGVSRDVAGYVCSTPLPCGDAACRFSSDVASLAPGRHHLRIKHVDFRRETDVRIFSDAGELDLEPEISIIAERAQALTGATGAAIALRKGDEIVCRARTGRTAPDLGVRLEINSGLSAECVRTGEVLLCEDAETNPCVDLTSCRRLGVRSILVAPLRHFRKTLGVFEVLSSVPYAFDHGDVTTMQFLASMIVAAISRLSSLRLPRD